MTDSANTDDAILEVDPNVDDGSKPSSSLRAVLDEIGAEESAARLELRIETLEAELERSDRKLHEFERARRGELDVMRARVEDVLGAVDEIIAEQRAGTKELEERMASEVADGTQTARAELTELRDVLTPRVQQAVHEAESHVSVLRGEMAKFGQETNSRIDEVKARAVELEKTLESFRAKTDQTIDDGLADQSLRLAELRTEVVGRLDALDTTGEARQQDAAKRLEGLRRELDATTGELRAAVSLRATELRSEVNSLREELQEAADVGQSRDDSLEARWIDATKDVAELIEQAVSRVEGQVRKEREERQVGADRSQEKLVEATARLDQLGDRVEDLKRPRMDDVRRGMAEVEARVHALQGKVATAVGQIASDLNNKVSVVGGDLEAVKASAAFHTEELTRLSGISDGMEDLRSEVGSAVGSLRGEVAELRREQAALVKDDDQTSAIDEARRIAEAAHAQTREIMSAMTSMQEELRALAGLRQEVRDQASTLVEAVTRAESAEAAAIQTRETLAAAVRRGREARAVSRPAADPPVPAD